MLCRNSHSISKISLKFAAKNHLNFKPNRIEGQHLVAPLQPIQKGIDHTRADEIAASKLTLTQRAMFKAGGILKVTSSARAVQGLSKLWMPLGRRVVIVGGGLVGLELAEFLLARDREVTVLEPTDKPGRGCRSFGAGASSTRSRVTAACIARPASGRSAKTPYCGPMRDAPLPC